MFNLKAHDKTAQMPYEKYNREKNLGPKADDGAPAWEKQLPHRSGFEQTITEDQMTSKHDWSEKENPQLLEKDLNTADSALVTHRSSDAELSVPPINVLVEKMRQKRAKELKTTKKSNWTVTYDDKKQNGSLPKWPKIPPQTSSIQLNNDPQRFSASNADPLNYAKDSIRPLTGSITTADIDRVADGIKTGQVSDYDTAVLAILRLAEEEGRELTDIERRTVVDLKIARTNELLAK